MTKTGLNYYTIDTDRYQNMRIKRLKKAFGCQGLAVYDYILCEIYRVEGCFLAWDDNTAFDVADYLGLKENAVKEIAQYCASVGLFNRELLCRGIVSSRAIQERYLAMCARAKRANVQIPACCIIREETPNIREETPNIREETPNIREENDKVKYSKVKESTVLPPPQTPPPTVSSSSSAGRGGRVKNLYEELCRANDVREDVWDAVAISNSFTNSYTSYYNEWLALTDEQRRGYPLHELNNGLRRQLPAPPDTARWYAHCWVKDNCPDAEWREIYRLSLNCIPELQKLIKECKKGKIRVPGQFIISRLKQVQQ